MADKRQLRIGHSLWPLGRHGSAWRLPRVHRLLEGDPQFYRDSVQTAERGLFDYFFLGSSESARLPARQAQTAEGGGFRAADGARGIGGSGGPGADHYWTPNQLIKLESFTATSFVAALSRNIGLAATFNTTYHHPYTIARQAATLDHLSGGRAAINIVTGRADDAARNYGLPQQPDTDDRWERAEEFIKILWSLWDGWEDGWLINDKAGGVYIDPDRIRSSDFHGRFFDVAGPINIPPSPQRRIPLIVAGASQRSFEFGAKYADVRFIPFADRQAEYYRTQKDLAAGYGRNPDDYFLLPGITFYVDETSTGAHARFREVQDLATPVYSASALGAVLGYDLTPFAQTDRVLDVVDLAAIPDAAWVVHRAIHGFGDEHITLADLDHFVANMPFNQVPVVGSGTEVADWIEEQFLDRKLDGVVVFPPFQPGALDAFVDLVVPELQRRGLFRTSYEGTTFRERLSGRSGRTVSRPATPVVTPELVDAAEAVRRVAAGAALFDVRNTPTDPVDGAVPVAKDALVRAVAEAGIARHQPVVVYCGSIAGSGPAADALSAAGWSQVSHVDGGYQAIRSVVADAVTSP
ncbi:NtaA/DmoA family FMN-dependent monooxygenase [Nakamurella leprariae]|uniref:NtaA/DmoA family FMN-dependent monooxygenase n=1 Tax=Nakamurella leprariae TaxID=2803911 RepID=A0A938YBQ7_9ACTN|nr:NtaA/DmoA family FMN-dependent monooxygenase [Nakamurella leprariae]MBM9469591.1 NtaA/DmoA family FMN-dependent monooxygenase [Nakamurella leprariae]